MRRTVKYYVFERLIFEKKREKNFDMSTSPSQILSIYTVNSSMDDSNCLLEEDNAFCTENNVEECAGYLSQVR